jgi:hypothetical protein
MELFVLIIYSPLTTTFVSFNKHQKNGLSRVEFSWDFNCKEFNN